MDLSTDLAQDDPLYEACDDGNNINTDGCLDTCQEPRCGDGILQADVGFDHPDYEECDDGNDDGFDLCRDDCRINFAGTRSPRWGRSVMMATTSTPTPVLRAAPWLLRRSIIQEGIEQCDDGNLNDDDDCPSCNPHCGDGYLQVASKMR